MNDRPYPFDGFPEKESDWREVESAYDRALIWIGYWRDQVPDKAIAELQDILSVPKK